MPADARLISASALQTDESAMTGESLPVEKILIHTIAEAAPVGDWVNMLLSGTLVTSGRGTALVVATGMDTQMGKIAHLLEEGEGQSSPLQIKMAEISKILSAVCLGVCAVTFGVGVMQGKPLLEMFMTAVALAVAAIPEGLPAIVSIVLALGVGRMAERGAIVKKLPAVETLGSAGVICSDKTGTLTQNKMTVQESFHLSLDRKEEGMRCATLCNHVVITKDESGVKLSGSPTEQALVVYGIEKGVRREQLLRTFPTIEEIPFTSERKLMTTLHPHPDGGYLVLVKGAPDVLLDRCTQGARGTITLRERQEIIARNEVMARKGMRVIAVAQRKLAYLPHKLSSDVVEQGLTFLSLFAIADPPRPEAKQAVAQCHRAGIRPIMITGDHRTTAIAIAKQLDIYRPGDWAATGEELDFMPQEVLEREISSFTVFARVSPEHKMRIVEAWQKQGQVVAMSGDGVNDAPALKRADIGCAMGIAGTDVAKGASEMILTNDNFATIVEAVEEGRGIYANIRKAVHYLLSCNIGEIVAIFVATLFGFAQMPLIPVQLLWLNLVTDTLPALALGVEPVEKGVMDHPPRQGGDSLFDRSFSERLCWQGVMVGCLTLLAYCVGYYSTPETAPQVANTMAFATLTLSQLFHAFNVRSEDKSLFKLGFWSNPAMNKAFLVGLSLQLAVLLLPICQEVFSVVNLEGGQWGTVLALAISPIPICELAKMMAHKKEKDQHYTGRKAPRKELALK